MNAEPYYIDFERKLIHRTTPTLAGILPASLFTCKDTSLPSAQKKSRSIAEPEVFERSFFHALQKARLKLAPCGVHIEVLARRKSGMLVFVYRPTLLKRVIQQKKVMAHLREHDYDTTSLSRCIEKLHHRICGTDMQDHLNKRCSFPHEIGFFLGYPYDDVMGFIKNHGERALYTGCWKVYARKREALACFCSYKTSTIAYKNLYDKGVSLKSLASVDECSSMEKLFA